ncbi:MAG: hypothetical protein ACFCVH_11295 [Alphaproteobacteria bacterium]
MAGTGQLRSGGSVAGVEIMLDTRGLATGPVPDRAYAPAPEIAARAPQEDLSASEPLPEAEALPDLADRPPQLAALDEAQPDTLATDSQALPPQRLEEPPPLQPSAEPEAAPPVLADEPAAPLAADVDAPPPPPPAEPVPAPAQTPPVLAAAPVLPPQPDPTRSVAEASPRLGQAPIPETSAPLPPAASPEAAAVEAPAPASAPDVVPDPIALPPPGQMLAAFEPPAAPDPISPPPDPALPAFEPPAEPDPISPSPQEPALAAFEPPAEPDVPVVRSFQAPVARPLQPDQPPAAEPDRAPDSAAGEPPAPEALALPPDTAELPQIEPVPPLGPLSWDVPFDPPLPDPRVADVSSENALQTGREDGLDSEIGAILSDISCGALNADVGAGGEVAVRGFLTSTTERESVRDRLLSLGPVTGVDDGEVLVVGNGLCDGLGVYASGTAELAPDAEVNEDLPPALRLPPLFGTVQGARETFFENSWLEIIVETPDYPAHVYIDYFRPDGTVVHLVPSEHAPEAYFPDPVSVIPISSVEPNGIAVPAGPPFGTGMVVTLSTSAPVFQRGTIRPREENAEEYLRDLDVALREREIDPRFRAEYGYVFVEAVRGER